MALPEVAKDSSPKLVNLLNQNALFIPDATADASYDMTIDRHSLYDAEDGWMRICGVSEDKMKSLLLALNGVGVEQERNARESNNINSLFIPDVQNNSHHDEGFFEEKLSLLKFGEPLHRNKKRQEDARFYEKLHERLLPSVKVSLDYLSNYVSFLLGALSEEKFEEIVEKTALESDNDISGEMISRMRALLEKYMGELDDSDFAAMINVDVDKVLAAKL